MSFLSLFFLTALPLAAAPLVLHLFDRRRNVVIEWGAMQFLVAAAARRTSARKLKQWLLLLLRVFMLAALICAMARPLVPGNWFGVEQRAETILIVDNSLSMSRAADADKSLLQAALEQGADRIAAGSTADSFRILAASPFPEWLTPGSVRIDPGSQAELTQQLQDLQFVHGRSDLLAALFTAIQAERDPLVQQRKIVVLTDGQGTDWRFRDGPAWERLRSTLSASPLPTQLDITALNETAPQLGNLAVNEIRADRTVVGAHQPVKLIALIQNHGRAVTNDCTAHWQLGEQNLSSTAIPPLDPGATHELTWTESFSTAGIYALSCQVVADDELQPDNAASVVVEVVDEVPFALIEENPDAAELQRDAFCIQAALGRLDGEELSAKGVYAPTVIGLEQLEFTDLAAQRAIVVPNLMSPTERQVELLRDFVNAGGGLWLALGPRTDVDAFNQLLYSDGHGLAPLAAERISVANPDSEAPSSGTAVTVGEITSEHPATTELADDRHFDLADVRVDRHFRFVPAPEGANVSILLRDTRGEPLAAEKYFGQGRVIVQGVPLKLQWTDLARSQSFVVLVRNWLDYLTQPRATRHNLMPGDPIAMHVPTTEFREATLRTPIGEELPLTGESVGDGVNFRSSRTSVPGRYTLEFGISGDRIPFQVNRDAAESDLSAWTDDEQQLLAQTVDVSRQQSASDSPLTAQHQPLWPSLLVLLILFLIAELFLSGQIARDRFGSTPISETSDSSGEIGELFSPVFTNDPSPVERPPTITRTS